jgi:putative flippase GtrA
MRPEPANRAEASLKASAGLARQFASFAGVGAVGLAVDAVLFALLTGGYAAWHPYAARAVSATCSITTTWALNRRATFANERSEDAAAEYVRYLVAQLVGFALNVGTFAAAIAWLPLFERHPMLALVLGAAVGLTVNFLTAKHIAFRKRLPR